MAVNGLGKVVRLVLSNVSRKVVDSFMVSM
jgi:hypothetical protein